MYCMKLLVIFCYFHPITNILYIVRVMIWRNTKLGGGARSMHERDEKCVQKVVGKC